MCCCIAARKCGCGPLSGWLARRGSAAHPGLVGAPSGWIAGPRWPRSSAGVAIEWMPRPVKLVMKLLAPNCVINLSADKPRVLADAFRVLRPGGRLGISDVIADEGLDTAQRAEAEQQIGCTTGSLTAAEYRTLLLANGFASIRVTATQDTEPGLRSAIIQAGDGHLCTSRAITDL